jgi:hypothetical protein
MTHIAKLPAALAVAALVAIAISAPSAQAQKERLKWGCCLKNNCKETYCDTVSCTCKRQKLGGLTTVPCVQ